MRDRTLVLAEELLRRLEWKFGQRSTYFAERYVAGSATADGEVTVIYAAGNGRYLFGRSWNINELRASFTPYETEDMADILWSEDISCPNGTGHVDADRARGVVDDPGQVRWVDGGRAADPD